MNWETLGITDVKSNVLVLATFLVAVVKTCKAIAGKVYLRSQFEGRSSHDREDMAAWLFTLRIIRKQKKNAGPPLAFSCLISLSLWKSNMWNGAAYSQNGLPISLKLHWK